MKKKNIKQEVLNLVPENYNFEPLRFSGCFQRLGMDSPADFLYMCPDLAQLSRVLDTMTLYGDEILFSQLSLELD